VKVFDSVLHDGLITALQSAGESPDEAVVHEVAAAMFADGNKLPASSWFLSCVDRLAMPGVLTVVIPKIDRAFHQTFFS